MAIKKPSKATEQVPHARHLERDVAGLSAALLDTDITVRRRAAIDLADFPEAVEVLEQLLKKEEQQPVKEAAILSLCTIGNQAALSVLIECLRSEDVYLRNEAIAALQNLPEQMNHAVKGLIADRDPDVRIFSINVLESLCHPDVEDWLIDVLCQEPNLNVCAAAIDVLVGVASQKSLPAILSLRERFKDEPYIIFASNLVLKRLSEE